MGCSGRQDDDERVAGTHLPTALRDVLGVWTGDSDVPIGRKGGWKGKAHHLVGLSRLGKDQ